VDSIHDFENTFTQAEVEKFVQTTGVRQRHYVQGAQTNSDLCYEAAERLIAHKGYEKGSFDGLIYVTQTPDYMTPATSHIIAHRLGLSIDCACMDVNLGCSGFVYGLEAASAMLKAGSRKRVLLCCGEAHTALSPQDDKSSSMLFGDMGSATIIEAGEGCIRTLLKSDGEGYRAIIMPGITARVKVDFPYIEYDRVKSTMDGGAVFEFAIVQVPRAFKAFFREFGGGIDDYDACVFHQANLFMLEHIRKKIKLPPEKMPVSMDRYGNTSSGSIPITICDMLEREPRENPVRLISSGFGVGLSWGVADFTLDPKDVLPIIETDAYWEDALV